MNRVLLSPQIECVILIEPIVFALLCYKYEKNNEVQEKMLQSKILIIVNKDLTYGFKLNHHTPYTRESVFKTPNIFL